MDIDKSVAALEIRIEVLNLIQHIVLDVLPHLRPVLNRSEVKEVGGWDIPPFEHTRLFNCHKIFVYDPFHAFVEQGIVCSHQLLNRTSVLKNF